MTRREPYWWKRGCFMTFWKIFPCKVKNIIFAWKGACEMRLNPHKVRLNIETNIEMNIPDGGVWTRWRLGSWGCTGARVGENGGMHGPEYGVGACRGQSVDGGMWGQSRGWDREGVQWPERGRGCGGQSRGREQWGPLSGIPSPLSGIPLPLSGIPSPLSGMPSPYPVSHLPYLVSHSPSRYPNHITSHQSGILHSLIFDSLVNHHIY